MGTPEIGSGRIPALDGLRGLAAAVVVLHHALLTISVLAAPYFIEGVVGDPHSLPWWLSYTPLHLFWDGTAAVYLFFVLSGVVLTLPVLSRGDGYRWGPYYVQRLLRIYLPVWGAVVLAALSIVLVHRGPHPSAWMTANQDPISPQAVINDLGLLTARGFLASPLWSLHWEILFSLLLPAFVWVAVQLGRRSALILPVALGAIAIGDRLAVPELKFLPMFLVGTILALVVHERRAHRARSLRWTITGALAALSICSPWILRGLGAGATLVSIAQAMAVAACGGLLLAALHSKPLRRVLESRPLQFLGRISFSLYLVHEPLVISIASLGLSSAISIPLSIVLAVGLAVAFHTLVEKPSHRLARRAAQRPFSLAAPTDRRAGEVGPSGTSNLAA